MSEFTTAHIVGMGHYLPEREVNNEEVGLLVGLRAEEIKKRTGISSRRWVEGRVYTSDLAVEACRDAFGSSSIIKEDIDCIVASTQSPDCFLPGLGVHVQAKLGIRSVPCYDIRDQCSGFLYALQVARAFIATGTYKRILVVCAELQSHGLGKTPAHAHTTPLFGDGAGAVIVSDAPLPNVFGLALGVPWLRVHADGRGSPKLRHRLFDVSIDPPWDIAALDEPEDCVLYPEMDGGAVFRRAVREMSSICEQCLAENSLKLEDIAYLLPHQANQAINLTVSSIMGMPKERLLSNIEQVGNTSSASIPVLLSETMKKGRIEVDDKVLCVGFGAGFTWGAALIDACAVCS